jgi:hypothetical protein
MRKRIGDDGSGGVEENTSALRRELDQLGGVVEVGGRDRVETGRWEHDQLGVALVELDVRNQPAVREGVEALAATCPARCRAGARARTRDWWGAGRSRLRRGRWHAKWACCSRRPVSQLSVPPRKGRQDRGMAALTITASTTGPVERSSSSAVTTSTATTCSGIRSSSSRWCLTSVSRGAAVRHREPCQRASQEVEQAADRVEREDLSAPGLAQMAASSSAVSTLRSGRRQTRR